MSAIRATGSPSRRSSSRCGSLCWPDVARYLVVDLRQRGLDFHATQRQGHTPLHKAAWGGPVDLCRWRRVVCGVLSRRSYFAVWTLSGHCLDAVWTLSGRYLDAVWTWKIV
ncbi:hypothetical protein EMIHUDRAFT_219234 [Emiliania huxleyi CCMP1516]|uniref:Ankyrin repeat protein n=2 Tax=Emiliania huxleyi TaxID=2903 RepID=A0A0D3I534_EMIH1|nr:hypothetical protein EMIHUDRAFT_219234 [Emiliania huxleyi CCMP1516]EOD06369.1 hypothetical protein EMIHUDRAFT_219234 [Emiliania huxleyi CCMP1516]|eukprot:XP_005758798.1 hypothetical protein EMIHUDRAFT_219234 [Emiliania huxleyi CCMP1516]